MAAHGNGKSAKPQDRSRHAIREPFLGTHSAISQRQLPCTHHLSDAQTSCMEGDGLFCRCRSSGTDRKGRPGLGLGLCGMETLKPCFIHMHRCVCSFFLHSPTMQGGVHRCVLSARSSRKAGALWLAAALHTTQAYQAHSMHIYGVRAEEEFPLCAGDGL